MWKKLLLVKEYRVEWNPVCRSYDLYGLKLGYWAHCIEHDEDGWIFIRCETKKEALEYGRKMKREKRGLNYYTKGFRRRYREEITYC